MTTAALPGWLDTAYRQFSAWHAADRVPHALLLHCPRGWGETRLASRLVCDLLGEPPRSDAENLAHDDLLWMRFEDDKSIYAVDQVRRALTFMQRTARSGGNKVTVVPDVQRMNAEGANTLLKALEEPPPESFWLLLCPQPGRLLATVRSRCQVISVQCPDSAREPDAAVAEFTAELAGSAYTDADPELRRMLAFEAAGAPEQVAAALLSGSKPLWPMLRDALVAGANLSALAEAAQHQELTDLLTGWQRYTHALASERLPAYATLPLPEAREALFRFVDELNDQGALAAVHQGLNQRLLLERLLSRWVTLLGK